MSNPFQSFASTLLNLLAPAVCRFCNRLHAPSRLGCPLCADCLQQAFPDCARCIQCGLQLGSRLQDFGWIRCRHCRANPTETRSWVAGHYRSPHDALAKALKFGGQRELARAMGHALANRFIRATCADQQHALLPDLFMPVPLSPSRLRERGYNQAALIARPLSALLHTPLEINGLVKLRETGRQASLSATARQLNLADAFACRRNLEGMHVGLVDDVMTTGATLDACSRVLADAGAAQVSRWLAWRTPERPQALTDTD